MPEIKKLDLNHPATRSADIVAGNIDALMVLFPDAFTEGKIDFEVLKGLLGATVDERDEKYGLNWHGKRRARQIALTPSSGTLLPCSNESVDWDTTQNLLIEGDNLEVLKLLQKSYANKVKLIYIDPPYNTGKDFVYPDDFSESVKNYLELTGQIEGGKKVSSNTEASGRFHTDWLNMMYPRLKLARNLMSEDGIIAISIDDAEAMNLRRLCDEIFGEENFIAQIVWKSRVSEDTRAKSGVSTDHEYIICYSRVDGVAFRGAEKDVDKFANPDKDERGPWRSADLTGLAGPEARPNLHYDLIDPATGTNYGCPPKGWRFEPSTMSLKISEGRILFPSVREGRPRHKLFLNEMRSLFKNLSSVVTGFSTADGTREVNQLMGSFPFLFPKPTSLMRLFAEQVTSGTDIVLDFFAGSGTTGHAVLAQNAADGGRRRYIVVQLPQQLEKDDRDQGAAAAYLSKMRKPLNIAELTKERLRRAAKKVRADSPLFDGDAGFRVFKLASSNIRAWETNVADLEGSLLKNAEHLVQGRKEQDVLYELLLKLGLDLCVPIEAKTIAGKSVHSIGGGALIVCLADGLSKDVIEPLASGIVTWRAALAPAVDMRQAGRTSTRRCSASIAPP